MDKTSKLFLESEIKRILNLNERVESGDFIMESLDNETLMLINNNLQRFLQKANIPDQFINDFISNIVLKDFQSGKFCDSRGKVKCVHLARYLVDIIKKEDITDQTDVSDFYNKIRETKKTALRHEVETYLGLRHPMSSAEADELLKGFLQVKDIIMKGEDMSEGDFNKKMEGERKKLMSGSFCVGCKDKGEIKDKFNQHIKKTLDKSLAKLSSEEVEEIQKELKFGDAPKSLGRLEYLSKKIEDLLGGVDKSSMEEEKKSVSLGALQSEPSLKVTMEIGDKLLSDTDFRTFLGGKDGQKIFKLSGNFNKGVGTEKSEVGKYFWFTAYPNALYEIGFLVKDDELIYPEFYKVFIKRKGAEKYENISDEPFQIKLKDISK